MIDLDPSARAKVQAALERMAAGNLSEIKSVGEGVQEQRVHWGPGYRIYFGRDGATLVVLLAGGTKKRQRRDVAIARDRWKRYRESK